MTSRAFMDLTRLGLAAGIGLIVSACGDGENAGTATGAETAKNAATPAAIVAAPATPAPAIPAGPVPQLIVFGVDAATPSVMQDLIARGQLPTIKRLMDEGSWGEMETIHPIFSPLIWTTMGTGRMPEDHGIWGFTWVDQETESIRPVTSAQRMVPALWNLASAAGYTPAVVGWPVTWPAEDVNGYFVSNYFVIPKAMSDIEMILDPEMEAVHPVSLIEEIRPFVVATDEITPRDLQKKRLQAIVANSTNLTTHAKDETFVGMSEFILKEKNPDVLMVYIQGVDVLGHMNWPMYEYYRQHTGGEATPFRFKPGNLEPYIDVHGAQPPLTGVEHAAIMAQGELIPLYYTYVDKCLKELLDTPTERPRVVCMISDHGYGRIGGDTLMQTGDSNYTRPLHWHLTQGFVMLHGPGVRGGGRIEGASVKDVFPTLAYLLRLPLAENLAGEPLQSALDEEYVAANPITRIPAYDFHRTADKAGVDKKLESDMLEQLRSLGYIR